MSETNQAAGSAVPRVSLTRRPEWDVFANQALQELGVNARCGPSLCEALNNIKGCVAPDGGPWDQDKMHAVMLELMHDGHVSSCEDYHRDADGVTHVKIFVYRYRRPTTAADMTRGRYDWGGWDGGTKKSDRRGWFGAY